MGEMHCSECAEMLLFIGVGRVKTKGMVKDAFEVLYRQTLPKNILYCPFLGVPTWGGWMFLNNI